MFSFVLPAPSLKATDLASYETAIQVWKDAVAAVIETYPDLVFTSSPPKIDKPETVPASTSKRGPNETAWLERTGYNFVRLMPDKEAEHGNKENYCAWLLENFPDVQSYKDWQAGRGNPKAATPATSVEIEVDSDAY